MLWRQFFVRVKVNHRSIYSRILPAWVCAVAMENKAYKMVFVYLKNPVVRLFSSFAHYELTLNPFCQHCSNKILTQAIFVIRPKSFSVSLKIPYVKTQIFRSRSFAWFVNYFCAKFLEILMTGSLEIGKFLQKQSVSIFRATEGAYCINWVLSILKKPENCWVLCIVTFSDIPLLLKTKAINTLRSITKKNSKTRAGIEQIERLFQDWKIRQIYQIF